MSRTDLARGWQHVPLTPRDEPLVRLEPESRMLVESIYRSRGYVEATGGVYVRAGVRERLRQAALELPSEMCLLVWDGWRSLDLQRRLHRELSAKLASSTELSGRALEELVNRYVSEPSDDPRCPSPHLTGGAVDLTLAVEGSPLDMGSAFDAFEPRSSTACFEREDLSRAQRLFRDRRRLLCRAMSAAGFSNYPDEWWHFDVGNQFWGLRMGRPAYYGLARVPAEPS